MKTELAIRREYGRVIRVRRSKKKRDQENVILLLGYQQVLAWVLGENASRPSKVWFSDR